MGPNKKRQQWFLSYIYYLDYFKTCCQDYTHKYASFIPTDALYRSNYQATLASSHKMELNWTQVQKSTFLPIIFKCFRHN